MAPLQLNYQKYGNWGRCLTLFLINCQCKADKELADQCICWNFPHQCSILSLTWTTVLMSWDRVEMGLLALSSLFNHLCNIFIGRILVIVSTSFYTVWGTSAMFGSYLWRSHLWRDNIINICLITLTIDTTTTHTNNCPSNDNVIQITESFNEFCLFCGENASSSAVLQGTLSWVLDILHHGASAWIQVATNRHTKKPGIQISSDCSFVKSLSVKVVTS